MTRWPHPSDVSGSSFRWRRQQPRTLGAVFFFRRAFLLPLWPPSRFLLERYPCACSMLGTLQEGPKAQLPSSENFASGHFICSYGSGCHDGSPGGSWVSEQWPFARRGCPRSPPPALESTVCPPEVSRYRSTRHHPFAFPGLSAPTCNRSPLESTLPPKHLELNSVSLSFCTILVQASTCSFLDAAKASSSSPCSLPCFPSTHWLYRDQNHFSKPQIRSCPPLPQSLRHLPIAL